MHTDNKAEDHTPNKQMPYKTTTEHEQGDGQAMSAESKVKD